MELKLIEISNRAEWKWALETVGGADVYYTPGYLIPLAQRGDGRPVLIKAESNGKSAVHLAFFRNLSSLPFAGDWFEDRIDLVSPYGYGGPILSEDDPEFAAQFWKSWQENAKAIGAVSEFIRFHPLLQNYLNFSDVIDGTLWGQTVYVDLRRDRIESGLSKTCHRNIRTAYKKGVEFELLEPVEWLNEFLALYSSTMSRKKATEFYHFDEDYFVRLFDEMLDNIWLARAHYQGKTGAFGLFLRFEKFLHYHLGCSDPELRALCPTNLLLYEMSLLAQKRGKQYFHLGGAYMDNFGLYRFKKGFSDKIADFYMGNVIYDQQAYDKLCELRAEKTRKKPRDDYFPVYRYPL